MDTVIHNIPPEYDSDSQILILGSFPSKKSRESQFFYGHPQNRFWKMLASIFHDSVPQTVEEKKSFLHLHHIALWDVIASCEISGSADSSIRNVVPNHIERILLNADIRKIIVNGKTAQKYYQKYLYPRIKREAICLPSTSPANASKSLDDLINIWSLIKNI